MSGDDKEDDFDLTPIDQLSEYSHESDTETDRLLEESQDEAEPEPEPEPEGEQTFESESEWDQGEEETVADEGDTEEEVMAIAEEETDEEVVEVENEEPEELMEAITEEDDTVSAPAPETPAPSATTQENFQDLRDFSEAMSYGNVSMGGNPPFSLLLRGVRYREDAERILTILREHELCNQENEKVLWSSLENGNLLIAQISEYSAIYLAHRLRRFDVDIQVGLSDEIYPSKHYPQEERGLISKHSLKQNINENADLTSNMVDTENIILTTATAPAGYRIHHYIQVVTAHSLLERKELEDLQKNWPQEEKGNPLPLNELCKELAEQLKNDAFKKGANAVIGINYQITPLTAEQESDRMTYKIVCAGDAVWLTSD